MSVTELVPKLFWIIRTIVHIMRMKPELLHLKKTDLPAGVRFKLFALLAIEFEPQIHLDIM